GGGTAARIRTVRFGLLGLRQAEQGRDIYGRGGRNGPDPQPRGRGSHSCIAPDALFTLLRFAAGSGEPLPSGKSDAGDPLRRGTGRVVPDHRPFAAGERAAPIRL